MALKRGQYGGRGLRNEWDEALQRGTLVRRTACEETAGCQPDDYSCLPREHIMARQRHSLYGSRAHLTRLFSASPFSGFQPLTEDKSIWLLFQSGRVECCLCVYCRSYLFFLFCLIDAFTLARLTEVFQRFICATSQVHVYARTNGRLGCVFLFKSCFLFYFKSLACMFLELLE